MRPTANELVNLHRLDEAMEARGLDALVARAGLNFTYLAGFAYPGTLARYVDLADSPRAVYVVWPRRGEPRIVLNAIARRQPRPDPQQGHGLKAEPVQADGQKHDETMAAPRLPSVVSGKTRSENSRTG